MNLIEKLKSVLAEIKRTKYDNEQTRLLLGSLLAKTVTTAKSLKEAEFKVFSQFGDDGIIQFITKNVNISVDKFVEFGVENYQESNTRFLLMNDNWRGLVSDGSKTHISYIKADPIYWRHELTAVHSFITVENINQILVDNGYGGKIGILSIDIDGNDYWVWKAIKSTEAEIVIVEYNSLFGATRAITVPYKSDFARTQAHISNLYFGASLQALCDLGHEKGYSFIGCNQAGNNAYFVKNEVLGNLNAISASEGYVQARFRESRNRFGELTYAREDERKIEISGMPVVNTRTGNEESF